MQDGQEILLTADGLKKIECELDHLRTVQRKRIADRIRDAKQFGEFSENSEYEDAKTEQAFRRGQDRRTQKDPGHSPVSSRMSKYPLPASVLVR
jgi:transcription elongation factor GreA